MDALRSLARLASSLALVFLSQACTAPAQARDAFTQPSFRAPAPGARIALLPAERAAPEVVRGEDLMLEALQRQLVAAGYEPVLFDPERHAELWASEVRAVGGLFEAETGDPRFGETVCAECALARKVSEETECALVLRPRLVAREARVAGVSAEWDGVRRPEPVVHGAGAKLWGTGTTTAMSVELLAFAADGSPQFCTYGGTSLPFLTDLQLGETRWRRDVFDRVEETQEGVRIALAPLTGSR